MITDGQKQYFINHIMDSGLRTGQYITKEINELQNERKEIYDSLQTLCGKRKCDVDQATPGDTTSIKLIRSQCSSVDDQIKALCSDQYVKLSDVMCALQSLDRMPVAPAEYHGDRNEI